MGTKDHTTIEVSLEDFLSYQRQKNTEGTAQFYHNRLQTFVKYCKQENIQRPDELDASKIRAFIDWLGTT